MPSNVLKEKFGFLPLAGLILTKMPASFLSHCRTIVPKPQSGILGYPRGSVDFLSQGDLRKNNKVIFGGFYFRK